MLEFKRVYKEISDFVQNTLRQVSIFHFIFEQLLSDEESKSVLTQIQQATQKLSKIDFHLESMALTLSQYLSDSMVQQDELAKSLKEIEVCYKKSKDLLERDLNKMEFKITQIKDTRERISLRHIKSLDIVEKVVHKVMPNSLTESQIQMQRKMMNGRNIGEDGKDQAVEQEQMSSIEQIRNDLENDDIFTLVYRGASGLEDGGQAEEEKEINTINEEEENAVAGEEDWDSNNSDMEKIKELQTEKKKILESIDEDRAADKVLIDQLYDMEIMKLKKSLKKDRRSAAQSHRNQLQHDPYQRQGGVLDLKSSLSKEFKSQSLKNSQKITRSNHIISFILIRFVRPFRGSNESELIRDQSANDYFPISQDQSPINPQPRYLKLARSEQQQQQQNKDGSQIRPQILIKPQILFQNSHEKQIQPQHQINLAQIQQHQQKPFVLNKKFVNLLKKGNNGSGQKINIQNNSLSRGSEQQASLEVSNNNVISQLQLSPKQ